MKKDFKRLSRLAQHVLFSMQGQQLIKEDVKVVYLRFYPQGILAKKLRLPTISLKRIERILAVLVARGLVSVELTRLYAGDSCKVDTPLFSVSPQGAHYIGSSKKK